MPKVGIWGLGIAAKSAVRFLHSKGYELGVMDKRVLSDQERRFLADHKTHLFHEHEKGAFFSTYDRIIPSQSIDLRPYAEHQNLWWGELDVFASYVTRPSIAVTGTLGKTSVTHLISQALRATGTSIATGGNIGIGLLDLAVQAPEFYVLELSSFQLELSRTFAPELAIITNLYPNHLDRHTFDSYIAAKGNLLRYQQSHHKALINAECTDYFKSYTQDRALSLFALQRPAQVRAQDTLYYFDGKTPTKEYQGICTPLAPPSAVPSSSFALNWLTVIAALDVLHKPLPELHSLATQLPEHRVQHIAQVDGIDFYDDSKSTVPQSTLAAVDRLWPQPIVLLLGGTSKGVDRQPFVYSLKRKVKRIHCFGAEAHELAAYCAQASIPAGAHTTLEGAVSTAVQESRAGDAILLSPSGASYDLFTDYNHRGQVFQELVREHTKKKTN